MARWFDSTRNVVIESYESPKGAEVQLRARDGNLVFANKTDIQFVLDETGDKPVIQDVALRAELDRAMVFKLTKSKDIALSPTELIKFDANEPITVVFASGKDLVRQANDKLEEYGDMEVVAEMLGDSGFSLFLDLEQYTSTDLRQI